MRRCGHLLTEELCGAGESVSELKLSIDGDAAVKRIFVTLVTMEVLFVLADIFFNYLGIIPINSVRRLFNIAREDSLQAWVASVQTLFVALVLGLIYLRNHRKPWAAFAAFFTFLAVDDGSKFHERIGTAVKQIRAPAEATEASLALDSSYTWQYVFGPFLIAMGIFILIYLWRELQRREQRWLVFAALAAYGLAVGFDFIEGLPGAYDLLANEMGFSARFVKHFGRVIEEFLELLGSTLFLVVFLRHFIRISPKTTVVFEQAA